MARLRSLIVLALVLPAACEDQGPRTPAEIVITPNQPRVPMGGLASSPPPWWAATGACWKTSR